MERRASVLLPSLMAFLGPLGVGNARSAELEWKAPVGCPDREALERRLNESIGMPLEHAAEIHFVCEVTQARSGAYRVELRVGTAAPRIIEAATCDQASETAAVAMALALGAALPDTAPRESEPRPTNAEAPNPAPAVTAPSQTKSQNLEQKTPRPANPTPSPLWWSARLGPSFDLGSLPRIAPGVHAALSIGFRGASARLTGTAFAEQRKRLNDGTGGDFSLWTTALELCGSTPRQSAHLSLCAGLELGRMKGEGVGALNPARSGNSTWITPRVDVEFVTAPWLLGTRAYLGAMAGLPLVRKAFAFDTNDLSRTETVHRADAMTWRLNAGLEIDWP